MYGGSLSHDDIIRTFQRNVPDAYVRDYRASGGYITICRNYRDIKWKDQTIAPKVERQVPAITLVSVPKGFVTAPTQYIGVRLHRPGWQQQFRKAMRHLSYEQMQAITEDLDVGEVFPGIV